MNPQLANAGTIVAILTGLCGIARSVGLVDRGQEWWRSLTKQPGERFIEVLTKFDCEQKRADEIEGRADVLGSPFSQQLHGFSTRQRADAEKRVRIALAGEAWERTTLWIEGLATFAAGIYLIMCSAIVDGAHGSIVITRLTLGVGLLSAAWGCFRLGPTHAEWIRARLSHDAGEPVKRRTLWKALGGYREVDENLFGSR